MARIVLDGESLTPGAVAAVARDGEAVALAPAARARNADARATLAALLERGEDVYGATTGVGALRDRQIDPPDREQLQWNLLRSHAVDAGPALPADVVRAAMVVRANQLGAGGAGVAEDLLDALVRALNQGRVPQVRQFGSLGTGDVAGLAQIALTLLCDGGSPHDQGKIRLGLRDAVGFTSSNAITIGRAALLAEDLAALHDCWLTVAALSFEAAGADPVVLDERVNAASRGGGQCVVAAR
ncbi:MAG: aromatic amino acid lyase, partial [Solirubrobacterales bacterium]|nr:aromatic amino acid lyase [Solirubrobacterales bacterium]